MAPARGPGILPPAIRRRIDGGGNTLNAQMTIGTIRVNLADLAIATVKTLIVLAVLAVLLVGIDHAAATSLVAGPPALR